MTRLRPILNFQALFDRSYRLTKRGIGLLDRYTIQNKPDGRHFQPLQGVRHFAQLRSGRYAGLYDYDCRIDKSRQVLRFSRG